MKVAVVGATGLVGTVILKVLEERQFPVSELLPVASERSVGRTVRFAGSEVPVVSAETALAARPQIALFSAGAAVSRELATRFAPSDAGWWTIPPVGGWTLLSRWWCLKSTAVCW